MDEENHKVILIIDDRSGSMAPHIDLVREALKDQHQDIVIIGGREADLIDRTRNPFMHPPQMVRIVEAGNAVLGRPNPKDRAYIDRNQAPRGPRKRR